MNLAPRKIKLRSFLMILSNLISIVVIIIFSMLLYLSVSEYIHNNTDAINRSKFEYMLSVIERNYNEIINISNYIRSNENLKTSILVFNDEKTLINNKLKALKYITNFLVGVKSQNRHIKSINIISRNNSSGVITEKRFYTLDYLISMGISKKLLKEEIDKILFCYPAWDDISSKVSVDDYLIKDMEKEIYVKFSFPGGNAHDASGNIKVSKDYGNVYIFLNNNFFREITAGRENLLILDSENKIIYNGMKKNNPNMKTGNIVDDLTASRLKNVRDLPSYNKDMGLYSKSLDNGWTLLYYFDKYGFFEKQERLKVVIFLLLAISFLCSFFLSNSLSKKILRPIKKLADFMSNYEYKGEKLEKCSPNQPGRKVTLRERIFCYFLLTIMLPVLLFMMLFNFRAIDLTNKEISAQFLNTFDKTGKYIGEYFGKKLMAFHNIIYDISMQEFIFNKKYNIETNSNYYKDINIIAEILRSYKYLGLENNEIRFYDNNKLVFSNQINLGRDMSETDFQLDNIDKGYFWQIERDELNNHIITITTRVSPVLISRKSNGNDNVHAKIRIPVRDIYDIFDNLKASTPDIFICDSYGKNIINESSAKIFEAQPLNMPEQGKETVGQREIRIGDSKYVAFFHGIERTPWYLIALYNYQDISRQSTSMLTSYIYLLIITFLLILLLSYMITLLILRPVNKMNNIFDNYSIDEISREIVEKSFINEIDSLRIAFDNMVARIESLFDDLLIANMEKNQLQLRIKAAEIVALQAQINPHFLYNTLDNLIYLIKNGYRDKACEIVTSLSRLFRFGISREDRIIPIKEELAYAKAYASIIKTRYGDSIDFIWDIDESVLEYKTVKLILQPLIENAVLHGFKNMKNGCIIWVKCYRKGKNVEFIVSDNGEGISQQKLREIKMELQSDVIGNKLGIFNVQARIKLQYGKDYGISFDNSIEKGTAVIVTIPLDEEGMEL